GKEIRRWNHETPVFTLAITADSQTMASAGGYESHEIRLWQVATGREFYKLQGHQGWVSALALSPNGKNLVSGDSEGTLRFWDLAARKTIHRGQFGPYISTLTFADDGKTVAVGGWDGVIHNFDVEARKEVQVGGGHQNKVTSVVFSPNGQTLYSSG